MLKFSFEFFPTLYIIDNIKSGQKFWANKMYFMKIPNTPNFISIFIIVFMFV